MNSCPIWKDEKGNVNEVLFCEEFSKDHPMVYSQNRFYDYMGEVNPADVSMMISKVIMQNIPRRIDAITKSVLATLKVYCDDSSFAPREDEIHLANGTLYTDGTWIPELKICFNRLNVTYDPSAGNSSQAPPFFSAFLNDLFYAEDIPTLQEYLGYCLIPCNRAQKMIFIIGNGGEGKSRLGVVLKVIFQAAMITANFTRIETNKFFKSNLINKLVLLDDDIPMKALSSTENIKNLVTAETPIDVEEKGKQSFQATLYSRIIGFGNGSPKSLYDKSEGLTRRLIILNAKPKDPNRIDDPFLADKLIAEKDQIFLWMFEGLQRLIRNNYQFTLSNRIRQNTADIMSESCNIPEFLRDTSYICFRSNYSDSTYNIYVAYQDWCRRNALTALSQNTFCSWLHNNAERWNITPTTHIKIGQNKEVRGYKGIAVLYRPI